MQVKIKNDQLVNAINLLFDLELRGKKSRHRTKFINKLNDRLKEVEEQRMELIKEHSHLDEEGNPKIKDDGVTYDIKDEEAFKNDSKELYEEELVLEGGDNQGMLKTVKDVLLNCDVAFAGVKAQTYNYLCDQFEKEDEE